MTQQGSNINSVELASEDSHVTIVGTLEVPEDYTVELLHVWLAQPGCSGENGAGLAIDCKNNPSVQSKRDGTFTLTAPLAGPGVTGVVGDFFEGPATASAIAVLSKNGVVAEVLQWSRLVMLSKASVPLNTEGEAGST